MVKVASSVLEHTSTSKENNVFSFKLKKEIKDTWEEYRLVNFHRKIEKTKFEIEFSEISQQNIKQLRKASLYFINNEMTHNYDSFSCFSDRFQSPAVLNEK